MLVGRRVSFLLGLLTAAGGLVAACGSDAELAFKGQGGGGASGTGGAGGDVFQIPGADCTINEDCAGGVCHGGICCDSAESVCADVCCDSGDVCTFDSCVTPSGTCVTDADCPDNHLCDHSLGTPPGTPKPGCSEPILNGKCVPLPPECPAGKTGPDCVPKCEFHPTAGQLDAVIEWQWGYDPVPTEFPDKADVWSTPAVARLNDANCDGKIDRADPPNIVFVSNDVNNTYCSNNGGARCRSGALRVLDGRSGAEVWSLDKVSPSSSGFAGVSVAIGDLDQDKRPDVAALTAEGTLAIIDGDGALIDESTDKVNGSGDSGFGWGGGLAIGDMDNDGWAEIAYGATVFTMKGGSLALLFNGAAGKGGGATRRLTHFVDLDNDGDLELLAGRTAYHHDGTTLWSNAGFDGFTAIGNLDAHVDGNTTPEVIVVSGGSLRVLNGLTGATMLSRAIPGSGSGGPPTVADFDGDGQAEIGVAMANLYTVLKPNFTTTKLDVMWSQTNHDNSSSVTGSSVFDFEGDGKAEVIYNDECFLWVYDGANGDVLFTGFTRSFTATEASIVADVDGDGHAEIVMVSNDVSESWHCAHHDGGGSYPDWVPPSNAPDYRGITVFGDSANSWVGTRPLWNQHAYSVTNVCEPRDSACAAGSYASQIPANQSPNWKQPWLNNFRQNVQDGGLFDAPDATVSLTVDCATPVQMKVNVRNFGTSGLPAGVQVDIYRMGSPDLLIGTVFTSRPLLAGQREIIDFSVPADKATASDSFQARIYVNPASPSFRECRDDNNMSAVTEPDCVK